MRDDAVSPVIGVMLMLSITIILAAVLMAFAGGMADTKPATPSVDLSAAFVKNGSDIVLCVSHNGGDALNPDDIKVTAYVRNAAASGTPLIIKDFIGDDTAWNAGETLVIPKDKTAELLGLAAEAVNTAAETSAPVEIGIYHIPSSNVIYHADILLEAA
ncbi:type IV pilin N-terminal domain-containing protein [Methanocorpusculum sp.]|nr:type IV pilin N-terminal domain-containing protein [Methanocorpusculum sp.]MBO5367582.1 type IV pilin N-terminal domain-containing protein [Methanocorpusculum sp.]